MPVMSAGTYDPWIDANHDGHINVLDLIKVANGLGSSGDPALNVTIANPSLNVSWPNATDTLVLWTKQVSNSGFISTVYSANGFAHLNVEVSMYSAYVESITIQVLGRIYNATAGSYLNTLAYTTQLNAPVPGTYSTVFSIPVPSQHFFFYVTASSSTTVQVSLSYYLTWG